MDSSCYPLLVDSSNLLEDLSIVLVDLSTFLHKSFLQGLLVLERDLTSVVRFRVSLKCYQSHDYVLMMARNDDDQQNLSARVGAVEGDITTIKLALSVRPKQSRESFSITMIEV